MLSTIDFPPRAPKFYYIIYFKIGNEKNAQSEKKKIEWDIFLQNLLGKINSTLFKKGKIW
jgi:hypothetical protein